MLTATNLGKRFGDRWLFRGLAFSLSQGDSLVIVGKNGAGKTTLLRTLAGLVTPSTGSVAFDVGDLRLGLSMSALEMSLYPSLSLREHLSFAADVRGCEAREDELLERIGLVDAADRHASKISTGMKARLKLALAIQPRPKVLLLDEPGAGLDEAGRALVDSIVAEQKERGCLIIATNEARERGYGNLELELA